MTGTEGFVIFVIALCILYLLSYFAFFRHRVELKDDQHVSTETPQLTNNARFIDSNPKSTKGNDGIMIVEATGIADDVEMTDLSVKSTVALPTRPGNVVSPVPVLPDVTSNDVHRPTNVSQSTNDVVSRRMRDNAHLGLPLTKPITINQDVLRRTRGVLETFVDIEKCHALYDDVSFAYPKTLEKINTAGSLDGPLCEDETHLNKWNEDSKTLRDVVQSMMLSMAIDLDNKRPYNKAILIFILKFVYKFTKTYSKNTRPWGDDDLGFIDMMHLLMIFMISPNTEDNQRQSCAKIILSVITRPGYAFGQILPLTNVAHTSTPFVVAKLLTNSTILKSDIMRINKAILREYSEIPKSGFHQDRSFSMMGVFNIDIPNTLCSKYKYELLTIVVRDLLGNTNPLTFTSVTDDLNKLIIHPTIKLGTYGISTFIMNNPMLNSSLVHRVPKDNYGLAVMPLARVLRLFTKRHSFAVRGIVDRVKYMPESVLIENGQTIPRNQFYAMQMRKPLSDRENRIKYPEFGCLVWDTNDELSSTANVFIQKPKSYVGMYIDVGVFYQSYTLYDSTISSMYYVEELIVIHDKASEQTLDFNIKIINSSGTHDLTYYGFNSESQTNNIDQYYSYGTTLTVSRGNVKTFNTKLRIKSNKLELMEPTRETSVNVLSYPITLNDRTGIARLDKSDNFALIKLPNKEPQVLCTSSDLSIARTDFSYDVITNQWISNKNINKRRR